MNKITKALKATAQIIKKPVLLNKILNEPDIWDKTVANKYNFSEGLPVIDFFQLFENPNGKIEPYSFSDGGSLPTDLLLLKNLAKSFKNCKYFEIGTWRGESAVNVSQVAEECYTFNLSDEELQKMNLKSDYIEQMGMFSKQNPKINHIYGNSKNYDFSALNKKFDLIFIDGDHHYDSVKNDTEKVFADLIHKNSVIVWHDYAYSPEEVRNQVFAGILAGLPSEMHKFLYHVEGTKSAVFIRKSFETKKLINSPKPKYTFKVKMEITEL